jgi:cell wall-associated NlpC family hydrolase
VSTSTVRTTASGGEEVDLDPAAIAKNRGSVKAPTTTQSGSRPQVVVALPPGEAITERDQQRPPPKGLTREEADAQIEKDLKEFRKFLATIPPASGDRAEVTPDGRAAVPFGAPPIISTVVGAANEISRTPYRGGGGHGQWRDRGYDCSGSVSFALAAAGLLDAPLTSGGFMTYGKPGPGKWITIYSNQGHMFMVVAGIRYDTSALRGGTRWTTQMRPTSGFVARHPPGL